MQNCLVLLFLINVNLIQFEYRDNFGNVTVVKFCQ